MTSTSSPTSKPSFTPATSPTPEPAWAIVLTTAGSAAEAETIAQALVDANLAACVNIWPITSIYRWQGDVQKEAEWQLVIKTRRSHFEAIQAKVRDLHSYDVPELLLLPIAEGSTDYLHWLGQQTAEQE